MVVQIKNLKIFTRCQFPSFTLVVLYKSETSPLPTLYSKWRYPFSIPRDRKSLNRFILPYHNNKPMTDMVLNLRLILTLFPTILWNRIPLKIENFVLQIDMETLPIIKCNLFQSVNFKKRNYFKRTPQCNAQCQCQCRN